MMPPLRVVHHHSCKCARCTNPPQAVRIFEVLAVYMESLARLSLTEMAHLDRAETQ